ncbi:hypothetical protein EF405_06365 [Cyclobacteriaceae bacterium YHN15]|nr:hypothetical protein EF405_06365 [Cyclobacteriaceae bacterium YHN15]
MNFYVKIEKSIKYFQGHEKVSRTDRVAGTKHRNRFSALGFNEVETFISTVLKSQNQMDYVEKLFQNRFS